METPYLPQAIFDYDFQTVYEPAEDTFILLDALEQDLNSLRRTTNICLECGSGSGTVITALAKALNENTLTSSKCLMLATDINNDACMTTRKCAKFHHQDSIQVVRTDLAESLVDRLQNSVDLLVFNPPYVPTDDNESFNESKSVQLAWAGGVRGRKLIDKFLQLFVPRLLSKPDGVAYVVALDKNDIEELSNLLVQEHNISGSTVLKRKAGTESLHVVKYKWVP